MQIAELLTQSHYAAMALNIRETLNGLVGQ